MTISIDLTWLKTYGYIILLVLFLPIIFKILVTIIKCYYNAIKWGLSIKKKPNDDLYNVSSYEDNFPYGIILFGWILASIMWITGGIIIL